MKKDIGRRTYIWDSAVVLVTQSGLRSESTYIRYCSGLAKAQLHNLLRTIVINDKGKNSIKLSTLTVLTARNERQSSRRI